jgi:hypothetical protein
MNLEERFLNQAAAEKLPEGIVEVGELTRDPEQFSADATKRGDNVGFATGAAQSAVSSGAKAAPTNLIPSGQVTTTGQKPLTPDEINKLINDPALRFSAVSDRIRDTFNNEPQSELIPLDRTMRQELAYSMQQLLVDKFGVDNYRAGRLSESVFGGDRSGAPLGLGLIDVTPFVIPLAFQESGLSAQESFKSADRGDLGQAAVNYGVGMLQGAEAIPAVGMAVKGLKAGTKSLAPNIADVMESGLRKTGMITDIVPPAPFNDVEKSIVSAAAGNDPELLKLGESAVQNIKSNYAQSNGWVPIEIKNLTFKTAKDGSKTPKIEAEKIPYNFHIPPDGVSEPVWKSNITSKIVGEVQDVVRRANSGDQAAVEIINQASWYRSMRDRLRKEFGGIGDVFADVLGTTSAQTGVEQNFENAVEILRRFSRGEYDKELTAYENRIKSGKKVDPKTLTAMHKSGEFPLITKASGELFNTNSPSSMAALLDMFRSVKSGDSPKTPNFTGNLIGLTNEATIDVWAARMLRRMADLPRIPPPAEKGVAGKHLVGSSLFNPKVGSEFGFGQAVFKDAADQINQSGIVKRVAPQIGNLGPDDLQAVAWFIEKEKWTNNGWTSKAGEGGSLDYEMSLAGAPDPQAVKDLRRDINKGFTPLAPRKGEVEDAGYQVYDYRNNQARQAFEAGKPAKKAQLKSMEADVDRYTLGVSGERPNKPMSNYAQAELAAEFDDVVRKDNSVITYNLTNTLGSFMAQTERALNAEFITTQKFNPSALERRLVEQGKQYDQDAVFISKVLPDGSSPNARPAVEIYFKQKITPQQMESVTQKLRKYGVDGFTYVTDMRFSDRINMQAKAGGADTAGLNGIRFQYIPEFDDAYNATNRSAIMTEKQNLFRKIVRDIIKEGNVSDARVVHYDTKVYFRDDYDAYIARTTGNGNQGKRGVGSAGANVAESNTSGEVGKEFTRAVSDRLRKKGTATGKVNKTSSAKSKGAE